MGKFATKALGEVPDYPAPDGSEVRLLLGLQAGDMAHFRLNPRKTSIPVFHRTVEEIWYFLGGRGEMWRELGGSEEVTSVHSGICITIPVGTRFQFRSSGPEPLEAIAVTMPPWPGEGEAVEVEGRWVPDLTDAG